MKSLPESAPKGLLDRICNTFSFFIPIFFRDTDQLKEIMLRIGAMDYEPSPTVKPFTLDQRLIETLNTQQLYDNKVKLQYADELINILSRKGA